MKTIKQILAHNIRSKRRAKDLTQTQLARKLGLTSNSISGIERGVYWPTYNNIVAISKALCVTDAELFIEHSK